MKLNLILDMGSYLGDKFNAIVRLFLFVTVVLTLSSSNLLFGQGIDSSYSNAHYQQRLDFFNRPGVAKRAVVFLGNSITEGGEWQELFPEAKVLNCGVSGDVTYGVYARLSKLLESKPSKIFLMIGINDLKRGISLELTKLSYLRIVKYIREASPETKLYLQSLLPVNDKMFHASYKNLSPQLVDRFNEIIKEIAQEQGLNYLDVQSVFRDSHGRMKKELSLDGIHLRSASYILWAKYLKDVHVI